MGRSLALSIILGLSLILLTQEAKTMDPYKVLGVERNASQREIQKAFHKLSLQYHPDKNNAKGAQEKFAEINNAYEILADEEKRKNYDLYGDEKGNTGFDAGYPGDHGGYTYFTSEGQGQNGYNFKPSDWQNMGGHGSSRSFSFSFSGPSSQNSFGFDLGDIFNMFGGKQGKGQFSGFSGSTKSQAGSKSKSSPQSSPMSMKAISSQVFKKEIVNQGMTWLILTYTPPLRGIQNYESIIQEIADSLQGALKVGSVNCESEISLCIELGIYPQKAPRLFIYSYKTNDKGSLVEYKGDMVAKNLKSFCHDHLPRFSKRIDLINLESVLGGGERLPRLLLLSTKRDTPVIWRVLSGLYHKQFMFIDAQVHDISDPIVKKLGVDALPAIVGWLSNGEKQVLKSGISVRDLKSALHDLSALLDVFVKKNKKLVSREDQKAQSDSIDKVPRLTQSNFDAICGEKNPVCIIGAFRSSKAKEKLEFLLSTVSQKSLTRRQAAAHGSSDSVSYALLDATRQSSFLNAFDKSGFKSSDELLVAYKPRKGKFATSEGDMTMEEVERFISSVLNGDVEFTRTRQKPIVK